ncbi:unnamed protein product [Diplocarpon coronariae]
MMASLPLHVVGDDGLAVDRSSSTTTTPPSGTIEVRTTNPANPGHAPGNGDGDRSQEELNHGRGDGVGNGGSYQGTDMTFTPFSRFVIEIRTQIWRATSEPRLIHWRPGGGKAPAAMMVCAGSRAALKDTYILCFCTLSRNQQYGVFVNFEMDDVYRRGVPNMVAMYNFPADFPSLPCRDPFTTAPITPAGSSWNVSPWFKHLKTLTIGIHEASMVYVYSSPGHRPRNSGQTIWVKIKAMFPSLETLNVVLNSGDLAKDDTLDQLVPSTTLYETGLSEQVQERILVVQTGLRSCHARGTLVGLTLNFVQRIHRLSSQDSRKKTDDPSQWTGGLEGLGLESEAALLPVV